VRQKAERRGDLQRAPLDDGRPLQPLQNAAKLRRVAAAMQLMQHMSTAAKKSCVRRLFAVFGQVWTLEEQLELHF